MQAAAKRLVAVKSWVHDVQASSPVSDANGPSGLLLPNGITAYRLNLLGAIVSEPEISDTNAAFVIDDGSGSLIIRSFEHPERYAGLSIGMIVNIIGRPRPSSDGIFIAPEIVKNSSLEWIAVRRKEIEILSQRVPAPAEKPVTPTPSKPSDKEPLRLAPSRLGAIEEEIVIDENEEMSPERRLVELIKKHDDGHGADAAHIISEANISKADILIDKLLKNGDIFAVGPGRYKVLE